MAMRFLCRLLGHKWVFQAGISHGHDILYECKRCGACDWREEPAPDREAAQAAS